MSTPRQQRQQPQQQGRRRRQPSGAESSAASARAAQGDQGTAVLVPRSPVVQRSGVATAPRAGLPPQGYSEEVLRFFWSMVQEMARQLAAANAPASHVVPPTLYGAHGQPPALPRGQHGPARSQLRTQRGTLGHTGQNTDTHAAQGQNVMPANRHNPPGRLPAPRAPQSAAHTRDAEELVRGFEGLRLGSELSPPAIPRSRRRRDA